MRYEILTMLFAARCLWDGYSSPVSPAEGRTRDVFLESFLLHYRNLRDFLCPRLKQQDKDPARDNVLASDFLDLGMAQNMADPAVLGRDRTRINKMLAHISYKRAEYKRRGEDRWFVQTMCHEMLKGLEGFMARLAEVAPHRRGWFFRSEFLERSLAALPEEGCYTSTTTTDISITALELTEDPREPSGTS